MTQTLDIPGARIELLTPLDGAGELPCVMRGTIPPGGLAALHSHPEPETFVGLAGELEGLAGDGGWVTLGPGDVLHIPAGERHAFRNRSPRPATAVVVSTVRLGRFFAEAAAAAPGEDALEHFLTTAARYGHWNATLEENARVGLALGDTASI